MAGSSVLLNQGFAGRSKWTLLAPDNLDGRSLSRRPQYLSRLLYLFFFLGNGDDVDHLAAARFRDIKDLDFVRVGGVGGGLDQIGFGGAAELDDFEDFDVIVVAFVLVQVQAHLGAELNNSWP
jgi:hypothetical protein